MLSNLCLEACLYFSRVLLKRLKIEFMVTVKKFQLLEDMT